MKKNILLLFTLAIIICVTSLIGCTSATNEAALLNANDPITITIWHYYNGQVKDRFDSLVEKFNETTGLDKGIIVDARSLGDINQLEEAVYSSASNAMGSKPLPNIFMSYPSNAYRVDKVSELVDLERFFSQEELERYRSEFLEEGYFGKDNKLKIIPIAKSTEILFLNKTLWDDFSAKTGIHIESLKTWQGVVETAKIYKNHTGKAFIGIDANANYMLVSSMQLGNEIYSYKEDTASFNLTKDVAKTIWDNYYIPYINGYFEKNGRFSSDDAKTGDVLGYIGSTSSSAYFPKEITLAQNELLKVEPLTLPYPVFENGRPYAVQQGAGMCITKSDIFHEYASALFLKWFTEPEQNVEFSVSTGYFPVLDESLKKEVLIEQVEKLKSSDNTITSVIESTDYMLKNYTLYSNKPFHNSYESRKLLEDNLSSKVSNDLDLLDKRVKNGESRELVIESLTSSVEFENWYNKIVSESSYILSN